MNIFIKRLLDFLISLILILIAWPLLILIYILVLFDLGERPLFYQLRSGLEGRPFYLYKFRTMTDARNVDGDLLPDAERLTKFGKFLRNYSLDELPELINVLKGDMSLVGPRPLVVWYLGRYTEQQARRCDVKPGITGWAQVNGRNAISWEEKFELDVWYIDNASCWLDIKILAMTVWKVFRKEGICHSGEISMPEFMGSAQEPLNDGICHYSSEAAISRDNDAF